MPAHEPTAAELSKNENVGTALMRTFGSQEYERSAAEARPEDNYGFRPAAQVKFTEAAPFGPTELRTFAEQVVRGLLQINPGNIPRVGEFGEGVSLDWRVLAFTLGVSILTGVVFGLIPAFSASRSDLNVTLKESGLRSGSGVRQNKARFNGMAQFQQKRPRLKLSRDAYRTLCKQVLERDTWRCQDCGSSKKLAGASPHQTKPTRPRRARQSDYSLRKLSLPAAPIADHGQAATATHWTGCSESDLGAIPN
jgi:hypothetical protein